MIANFNAWRQQQNKTSGLLILNVKIFGVYMNNSDESLDYVENQAIVGEFIRILASKLCKHNSQN